MPFVIAIVAVLLIIVLSRSGVASSLIAIAIPLIFSTLGGAVTAGFVSAFATPFVGVPVGLVVGIFLFSKFVKSI